MEYSFRNRKRHQKCHIITNIISEHTYSHTGIIIYILYIIYALVKQAKAGPSSYSHNALHTFTCSYGTINTANPL